MIFFLKLYNMLAWMRKCMSGICSIFHFFHFFINLRNVGGVMHMHTLWIIDDVWHAMIFFLNLDDDVCVDAWMHGWNLLYSKRWITHVCMTWYDVWITLCMNFLLYLKKKTNLNCSPFQYYFEFMELFYFDIFLLFQIISLV